jgi:antitoxin ParD1/3/4
MNIELKPEQEQFIQEKLNSGKYRTVDEVILEAFRLLEERDKQYEKWVQQTREKVAIGITQLEQGEGLDGESVMTQIQEKFRNARETQK